MTQYRRDVLLDVKVQSDTHAGLWLEKYLKEDGENAKKDLVTDVTGIQPSKEYGRFFLRWKATLEEVCGGKNSREAETHGRLAVNLGAESVLETSVALHHTYGTPFIPGSALKGLAAHYVIQYLKDDPLWDKKGEAFRILFGDSASAGYVTFFDALYVPGTGKGLVADVITVHHPAYYQGTKPEYSQRLQLAPPADWDSPTPIPFITASGSFLIAISGPEKWVERAFEILELALEREGVGAKTSSGYGRMKFVVKNAVEERPVEKEAAAQQEALPSGYQRGVVKKFMDSYGFIQPDIPGPELFVHIHDLAQGLNSLSPKQRVIYKPGPGRKPGQIQAFDVRLAN